MENNNTTVDRELEGKVRLKLVTIITIAGTTLLSASLATMRITILLLIEYHKNTLSDVMFSSTCILLRICTYNVALLHRSITFLM